MAKNTTSYEQDIKDTFTDKSAVKDALKIAKHMKQAQAQSQASETFKVFLKKRLESIHSIDARQERIPRLHILRNFAVLCSFFFVSWVVFMVLDSRDISQEEIYQKVSEEDQWNNTKKLSTTPKISQENIEPVSSELEESNKISDEILSIPESKKEDSEIQEVQIIEPTGEETERAVLPQIPVEDLDIEPELLDMMWDEGTFPSNSMMLESQMMMDESSEDYSQESEDDGEEIYEDSQAIYEYYQMQFREICTTNKGIVLDDDYTCEFSGGFTCSVDTIQEGSLLPCEYLYGPGTTK